MSTPWKALVLKVLTELFVDLDASALDRNYGDLVMVHGRYEGLGPNPMVGVDIYRVDRR